MARFSKTLPSIPERINKARKKLCLIGNSSKHPAGIRLGLSLYIGRRVYESRQKPLCAEGATFE